MCCNNHLPKHNNNISKDILVPELQRKPQQVDPNRNPWRKIVNRIKPRMPGFDKKTYTVIKIWASLKDPVPVWHARKIHQKVAITSQHNIHITFHLLWMVNPGFRSRQGNSDTKKLAYQCMCGQIVHIFHYYFWRNNQHRLILTTWKVAINFIKLLALANIKWLLLLWPRPERRSITTRGSNKSETPGDPAHGHKSPAKKCWTRIE